MPMAGSRYGESRLDASPHPLMSGDYAAADTVASMVAEVRGAPATSLEAPLRHTFARLSSTTAARTQTPSVATPVSPATYAMFQPAVATTPAPPRSKTVLTTLCAIA